MKNNTLRSTLAVFMAVSLTAGIFPYAGNTVMAAEQDTGIIQDMQDEEPVVFQNTISELDTEPDTAVIEEPVYEDSTDEQLIEEITEEPEYVNQDTSESYDTEIVTVSEDVLPDASIEAPAESEDIPSSDTAEFDLDEAEDIGALVVSSNNIFGGEDDPGNIIHDATFEEILGIDDTVPAGFDNIENPLGMEMGEEMFLSYQNEALLYQTYDATQKKGRTWTTWYKDWGGEGKSMTLAKNNKDEAGGFAQHGSYDSTRACSFVQSVAFDPTGSGRKDHVAYIGYNDDSYSVVVWVIDTTNSNRLSNSVEYKMSKGKDNWIRMNHGSKLFPSYFKQYEAGNFFSITAGDYDGDGKDTIVAYITGDGDDFGISELEYDNGKNSLKMTSGKDKSLLHRRYVSDSKGFGKAMAETTDIMNKLSCAVTTGDFNHDKIDDLAVLSYINEPAGKSRNTDWMELDAEYYSPFLSVRSSVISVDVDGKKTYSKAVKAQSYVREEQDKDGGHHRYASMVAPGMGAGDVDEDGYDELIIAGYYNTVITNEKNFNNNGYYNIDKKKFTVAKYDFLPNGSPGGDPEFFKIKANGWSSAGFYEYDGVTGDRVWSPLSVKCVAFNGLAKAKHVFINGSIYAFSEAGPSEVYTPHYFTVGDKGAGRYGITNEFIASAAPGNYDGNMYGYEQIAFTVGLKETGKNNYIYFAGMIGGRNYGDDGGEVGTKDPHDKQAFYYSQGDYTIYGAKGAGVSDKRVNLVITAIDKDNDGIKARYKEKGFVYNDPQVLAVIQAAPYFKELGDYSGSTSFDVTETFTDSHAHGDTGSWGFGFTGSIDLGGVIVGVTEKLVGSAGVTHTNATTTSQTGKFAAGAHNTVAVRRIPIFTYSYEIYDPKSEEWKDYAVSVPQPSNFYQMTVEEYNALAKVYNERRKGHIEDPDDPDNWMKEIDTDKEFSWLKGNEGNPWAYAQNLKIFGGGNNELGYCDGSQGSSYSKTESSSKANNSQYGFSIDYSLQYGDKEAKAGAVITGGYMRSYCHTTTNADASGISGTVKNLDISKLAVKYPTSVTENRPYKFTWSFGQTTCDLGKAGKAIPVIGYNVAQNTVTAPAPAVKDLCVLNDSASHNKITLVWTNPNPAPDVTRRNAVTGYNVYVKNKNNTYTRLNDEPLLKPGFIVPKDEDLHNKAGRDDSRDYNFVVTTLTKMKIRGVEKEVEGVWSNETAGDFVNGKQVTIDMSGIQSAWAYDGKSLDDKIGPDKDKGQIGVATGKYGAEQKKYDKEFDYALYDAETRQPVDSNKILDRGTYILRASVSANETEYTGYAYKKVAVTPAKLSITPGTCSVSKEYDGTLSTGTVSGNLIVKIDGIADGDAGTIPLVVIPDEYTDPNVGGQDKVTLRLGFWLGEESGNSVSGTPGEKNYRVINPESSGKELSLVRNEDYCYGNHHTSNYTFGYNTHIAVSCNIVPKPVDPDIKDLDLFRSNGGSVPASGIGKRQYTGHQIRPGVMVEKPANALNGAVSDEPPLLSEGTDYEVIYDTNVDAGKNAGKVTIRSIKGSNYIFADKSESFDIEEGDYKGMPLDMDVLFKKGDTGVTADFTADFTEPDIAGYNGLKNALITGAEVKSDPDKLLTGDPSQTANSVSAGINITKGCRTKPAVIEVTIESKNYNDIKAELNIIPSMDMHDFSDECKWDNLYHWRECKNCGAKTDYAQHDMDETDPYKCKGCGYVQITDSVDTPLSLKVEIAEKDPVTYDGTEKTPSVNVYGFNNEKLTEGKDYTVQYTNNVLACVYDRDNRTWPVSHIPSVIVTAKGNYSGTVTQYFEIMPYGLDGSKITAEPVVLSYNGSSQQGIPNVYFGDDLLTYGKDYTVEYPDTAEGAYKDAPDGGSCDYDICVKGLGNFGGEKTVNETITKLVPMGSVTVSDIPAQSYTGYPVVPDVTLEYSGQKLTKGTDYTVSCYNNISAGTARITFTSASANKYAGSVTKTFTINGTQLTSKNIKIGSAKVYYNPANPGSIYPDVIFKAAKKKTTTLRQHEDYELVLPKEVKKGKIKVVIKGKGGYTGSVTKTITLLACPVVRFSQNTNTGIVVDISKTNIPYMKGGVKLSDDILSVSYKAGSTEVPLTAGKDYKLSYSNNNAVNTYDNATGKWDNAKKKPVVKIKFTGNYTGTITENFGIGTQDLSNLDIFAEDIARNTKAGKYKTTVAIYDNGKKLKSGSDYTLTYYEGSFTTDQILKYEPLALSKKDSLEAGDEYVTVLATSKGSKYTGCVSAVYNIKPAVITKAKVTLRKGVKKYYNGRGVELSGSDLIVKSGKQELEYGRDYEFVHYENNDRTGKATVTIQGTGDFGGTKRFTFKIYARKVSLLESFINMLR